jgi:hypothetical protein
MSGFNVPYHLRTNKFVERQLFSDVLDFARIWNGPSKYLYVSMGGRFLEDFKILHERYSIDFMISLETDKTTAARQEFNRPLGCIRCINQSSKDFVDGYLDTITEYGDVKAIIWLDYTAPNDRDSQLQEYEDLVTKLNVGDIVKITLNANYNSKHHRKDFSSDEKYYEAVLPFLTDQLAQYIKGEEVVLGDLTNANFATLLATAVESASLKGIQNSEFQILQLAAFRYSDGPHQMLTVTAMVIDDELRNTISNDIVFQDWPCRSIDWSDVKEIRVPDMSQRERAFINSQISRNSSEEIHTSMPFKFDTDDKQSFVALENYIKHYRRYPPFGRVYV